MRRAPSFKQRVNYAAKVISEGGDASRRFDSCFEMGDGGAVVRELVWRSESCARLAANLPKYINPDSITRAKTWGIQLPLGAL